MKREKVGIKIYPNIYTISHIVILLLVDKQIILVVGKYYNLTT